MNQNEVEINQTGIYVEHDLFKTEKFAEFKTKLKNFYRKTWRGSVEEFEDAYGTDFKCASMGALIDAFFLAQKYWRDGRSLIPFAEWIKVDCGDCIIECGFAEKRENGVYVFGIKEQCLGLGLGLGL
jgi:hypothetical protein